MGKISKKVLEKIKKEDIKPIGKLSFVLKDSFVLFLFILNIIFGSIGLAISLYLFRVSDIFDLILSVNDFIQILIISIPIIWILITLLFLFVSYLNFKYSKGGYRFSFVKIFFINLLIIFVLGVSIDTIGLSERLNRVFSTSIPMYQQSVDPRYQVWNRPEEGYLAGEILKINVGDILIEDLSGNSWNVDISDANIRRVVDIQINEKVKIRGRIGENNTFIATDILPWEGRRNNMQQNHR